MSTVEITSMSTKGQVVIPASIRKKLNIQGGAKLVVVQDGESILMKPIASPKREEFNRIMKVADEIMNDSDLTEEDVVAAIKESRAVRANRS